MPPKAGAGVRFTRPAAALAPYVDCGLVPLPSEFTLEGWATFAGHPIGDTDSSLFGRWNSAQGGAMVIVSNGLLRYYVNASAVTGPTLPADGAWHHVAFVHFADGSAAYYLDGAQAGTSIAGTLASVPVMPAAASYKVGAYGTSPTSAWNGRVAGHRAWGRALSADEVLRRFRGREISPVGLVLDLPLDEGVGVKALDRTANMLDGTLTGGAQWAQPKAERGYAGTSNSAANVTAILSNEPLRKLSLLYWTKPLIPNLGGTAARPVHVFGSNFGLFTQGATSRIDTTTVNQTFTAAVDAGAGGWHHHALLVDMDAALVQHYGDGAGVTSRGIATPITIPAGLSVVAPNASLGGQISRDIVVFSRVLSQAEIRWVMLGGDPTKLDGCIAHFPLDQDVVNRAPRGMRPANRFARTSGPVSYDFEDGTTTGWVASGGTIGVQAGIGRRGRNAMVLTTDGTLGASVRNPATTSFPPVVEGEVVTASCDLAAIGSSPIRRASLTLTWVNSGGAGVGVGIAVTNLALSASEWRRFSITGTVPVGVGAVNVRLTVAFDEPAAAGERIAIDGLAVRGGTNGEWAPGSEVEIVSSPPGVEMNLVRPVRLRARATATSSRLVPSSLSAPLDPAAFGEASTVALWVQAGRTITDAQYLATLGGLSGGGEANTHQLLLWRLTPNSVAVRHGTAAAGLGLGAARAVPAAYDRPVLFVATRDASFQRQYQDGVQVDVIATVGAAPAVNVFRLGAVNGTDSTTDARYGVARVWNRALSADEVVGLVRDVVPRIGLQGEWLTDGSVSNRIALDTSGKGRHGVLSGGMVAA